MEDKSTIQRRKLRAAVVTGMVLWSIYTLYVTGRLLFIEPLVSMVLRIHPGMTMEQVVAAAGAPKAIYPPEQQHDAYNGWYPKPMIGTDRPIWVYEVMASYRVVVYWDKSSRVECIDVVYT